MTTNDASPGKGRSDSPVSPIGDKLLTRIKDAMVLWEEPSRDGDTQIERAARIARQTLPTNRERPPSVATALHGLSAAAKARSEADYIEALLIRYARKARVPWADIATALGLGSPQAAQARWKARESLLAPDDTTWQLPQGGLREHWAFEVAEQIRLHFDFEQAPGRTGVFAKSDGNLNGKGDTTVTITINDSDNRIRATVLDGLPQIELKAVFPGPFDPARYEGDADLAWTMYAESDEAEASSAYFLGPAWDEDPRRLGERLAAELANYQH